MLVRATAPAAMEVAACSTSQARACSAVRATAHAAAEVSACSIYQATTSAGSRDRACAGQIGAARRWQHIRDAYQQHQSSQNMGRQHNKATCSKPRSGKLGERTSELGQQQRQVRQRVARQHMQAAGSSLCDI